MYLYTLKVSGPEGKLDEHAIKAAVDRSLLCARRPVTFRFGKMTQVDSTLSIELATDFVRLCPMLGIHQKQFGSFRP